MSWHPLSRNHAVIGALIVIGTVALVGGATWAAVLVCDRSPIGAALLLGSPIVLLRALAAWRLRS